MLLCAKKTNFKKRKFYKIEKLNKNNDYLNNQLTKEKTKNILYHFKSLLQYTLQPKHNKIISGIVKSTCTSA